jgi:hypothetical protein
MFRLITLLFLISSSVYGTEVTTGNILNNSTFGTGNTTTTTGWSTSGDEGIHTHGAWNGFPYQTGMDDTGGVLAFEGHEEDNVYQDVDLVGDGHLTQSEMNQGFTSTMGADAWFWNNIENTLTLKQTITGADGSVSTQVREITGTSSTTGNKFTNYTNQYIQGSNTQTDITIRAELFNQTAGTAYDNSHRGPDVDNVTLDVTYNEIPPINEDAQEAIDDIEENIPDIPEDWYDDSYEYMPEDDWSWQDDYVIIEDDYIDDFEEFAEYDMEMEFEDFDTVVIEDFEEFEITEFEEPNFEFFEETDFDMSPPENFFEEDYGDVEIIEEIFEEEFEEEFTAFLEESGMAEEFAAFLEEEGMTEQEFFEEIAEEEFNDEFTEESFEEIDEPLEDSPTKEESLQEVAENETEAMEPEQMEEPASENNVAKNDTESNEPQQDEQEEEPDSKGSEDSEVQSEEDGEQETVQQEERQVDSKDGIATNVAKIDSKINNNLKNVAKQIAKIVKQNTKNLTKEELFFKDNNGLNAYVDQDFYKSKDIYQNNLGLFDGQIDLGVYSMQIYVTASLAEYVGSDPIEKRIQKLDLLSGQKAAIMLELKILRGE